MKTFFTTEEEISIITGQNNELLLNKLVSPYLRKYPRLMNSNMEVVDNNALNYLILKFDKYDNFVTPAKDRFYAFCITKLRAFKNLSLRRSRGTLWGSGDNR